MARPLPRLPDVGNFGKVYDSGEMNRFAEKMRELVRTLELTLRQETSATSNSGGDVTEEIAELQTDVAQLETDVSALNDGLDTTNNNVSNLTSRVTIVEGEIDALQAAVAELENPLDNAIVISEGAVDAGKFVKTDATGALDETVASPSTLTRIRAGRTFRVQSHQALLVTSLGLHLEAGSSLILEGAMVPV